jgi:hypothetical protein
VIDHERATVSPERFVGGSKFFGSRKFEKGHELESEWLSRLGLISGR